MIDARHGFVIGARGVTGGQGGKVIVPGEHFTDALPQPWVEVEHALDMGRRVLVVGIETGQERMKVLALRGGKFIDRRRDDHIRCAVPIGIGVVTGVVARALGLVFVPFLGHGNPGNHDVLNAVVRHGLEQLVHAGGFLEKIHVMQVRVAVGIVTGLHGKAAGGEQQGETQAGSRHGKTSIRADTGRPCASLQGSAWKKPEHWSASMLYNCMTFILRPYEVCHACYRQYAQR